MEFLKVQRDGKNYLLFDLTAENVRELQHDSQKLSMYFNNCLETGRNICIDDETTSVLAPINTNPSSVSASSTSSSQRQHEPKRLPSVMMDPNGNVSRKFSFLCGKEDCILAVKFANYPWHYFETPDSKSTQHDSLPAKMRASIRNLDKVRSVSIILNDTQSRHYFKNGKFIFKKKELKPYLEIAGNRIGNKKPESKSSYETTRRLVFVPGQTNPLIFLKNFENSPDIKNGKDKMHKLLHFVEDCHKGELTQLYFTSDWFAMKSAFLKLYTLPFVENKKRELEVDFDEAETLRSFFERKLASLSNYTTLPFVNQIEIIINELPVEISCLFIQEEKMLDNKVEILDYCDSIQNLMEHVYQPNEHMNEMEPEPSQQSSKMKMKIINLESGTATSQLESVSIEVPQSNSMRGRGGGRGNRGRGGGRGIVGSVASSTRRKRGQRDDGLVTKKLRSISEDDETDGYTFLREISDSSQSTWSESGL